jgi:ferredoxin
MTYVVVESCIKCKYMDCVEVCPVDCFYEGENMLVIHPDECIDCAFASRNARSRRSKPDTEPGLESFSSSMLISQRSGLTLPRKRGAADAKAWEDVPGKPKRNFRKIRNW